MEFIIEKIGMSRTIGVPSVPVTLLKVIETKVCEVREDGKAIPVMLDDNGEVDRFKEGLARIKINGKIGFFNKTLDIVLNPIYDFAFPFHNGVAEICVGCQEVIEGGPTMLNGGSWKRIDRTGLILEE